MATGDPMCPCGCGAFIMNCRGNRSREPLIPFASPPSPLGMTGPEAVQAYVDSLGAADRIALIKSLQKKTHALIRSEWRSVRLPLGKWIRRSRKEKGLTQLLLAEQLGLSRPALNNMEAGKQSCAVEMFLHICFVLTQRPDEALAEVMNWPEADK